MELHLLKTFSTVAHTASVTRAAQLLHTTPPSISTHIRKLEEHLDIKLFTRTPKGMVITSQGKKLLEKAQDVLVSVQQLEEAACNLKTAVKGHLWLGINADPEYLKITQLIESIFLNYPGIKLEIVPSSTTLIFESLEKGQVDCGFAFGPVHQKGVAAVSLCGVELVIVIPARFQGAYQAAPLESLTELAWIVPDNECPFFRQVNDHFRQCGLRLDNRIFANDDITKLALVQSGAAVCVLEKSEAAPFLKELAVVPWKGPEKFVSQLSFVFSENQADDILISAMVSVIKEIWNITTLKR